MKDNENFRMLIERFEKLDTILKKYKKYCDFKYLSLVSNELQGIKEQYNENLNEARTIRLGIVGQVKAGKSSFLNSMFFNNNNILPKAATPMTASLTRLIYTESNQKIVINFYTNDDWKKIEDLYKEYKNFISENKKRNDEKKANDIDVEQNIPEELKAAKEIFEMASNIVGFRNMLYEEPKTIEIKTLKELKEKLVDYVGVNGKYTPLTKSIDVYLNIDELKDLEIVDTPGINDPIISRGRMTDQFLKKCDVVFLVCSSSQFLGKQETTYLFDTLPNEGINDITIIGTKFDSVILDEADNTESCNLEKIAKTIYNKLQKHAKETILPIVNDNRKKIYSVVSQKMREGNLIEFCSSVLYGIAIKDYDKLDDIELHIYDKFKNLFPDFFGNKEIFKDISNIENIKREHLTRIKKNKESILKEKLENFIAEKKKIFSNLLNEIIKVTEENYNLINNTLIEKIRKSIKNIEETISKSKKKLNQFFEDVYKEVDKEIDELLNEIRISLGKISKIEEKTFEENKIETYWVDKENFLDGIARWLGNLFNKNWGREKRERIVTIVHTYSEIRDFIDNIEGLIETELIKINDFWMKIVNKLRGNFLKGEKSIIQEKLCDLVLEIMDSDFKIDDFNVKIVRKSIENTISNFSYPEKIKIDSKKYIDDIISKFGSSKVEGEENISKLRNYAVDVVKNIVEEIKSKIEALQRNFEDKSNKNKDVFFKGIKDELDKILEKYTLELQEKEEYIKNYKKLIDGLNTLK